MSLDPKDEIHIDDFILLTGTHLGDYGIYHISETAVTARLGDLDDLAALSPRENAVLLKFKREAELTFPTTRRRLVEWIENQGGDFTLPDDFEDGLTKSVNPASGTMRGDNALESPKGGRPKTREKKVHILRRLIECMITNEDVDPRSLPGSAEDLLDACQLLEKAKRGKCRTFSTTEGTFKTWLRSSGYGFKGGRPLKEQARYWTGRAVKTIDLIDGELFSDVFDDQASRGLSAGHS